MNQLMYAELARAAYNTAPTIGREDSAARAILTKTEDGPVVSFPGTNNLACWLADLEAKVTHVDGLGEVHEGFWEAYSEIAPSLAILSPTVTVGHSEGAALAILYAAALCLAGKPPRAIFAFEPPRVSADPTLRALLIAHGVDIRLYRNGNDIVPMIPRIFNDWQHPAPLIAIGEANHPFPNVDDHSIDRVIEALTPRELTPIALQLRG